jgi:hypothetical protein
MAASLLFLGFGVLRAAEYLVLALSLYLSLFLITAGRQAGADIHGAAKTLMRGIARECAENRAGNDKDCW